MNRTYWLMLMLLSIGQVGAAGLPDEIERFHDDEFGVTCWTVRTAAGGLSCIPDSQLEPACGPHPEEIIEPEVTRFPMNNLREEWFQL